MSTPFPRLRSDLAWRRFVLEGRDTFTFKDEISRDYLRLDVFAGTLALKLDGTVSPAQLLDIARATWPSLDFDEDYIADLLDDLKRFKLIEDPFERNAMLAARARDERARIGSSSFKDLFSIRFGAFNPDRFLTRAYPRVAFLFQPLYVKLGIALFALAGYVIWLNRDHLASGTHNVLLAEGQHGLGVLLALLVIFAVVLLHELGHGFAVKHFGGQVQSMGFLVLYGMPCMFCDTSDSHLFPERNHRVYVALAGTYIELYAAALATLVWWLTPQGLMVNQLAYNVMMLASISGILLNYNPMIKLDGYFVLADLLDMPGLLEDAYGYLGYLFRRHVLRMNVQCPVQGRRRKRVLAIYGTLSILYSAAIITLTYVFLRRFLIQAFALLGVLASLALLVVLVRKPLRPMIRTARLWALDHRGTIRRRLVPWVGLAALGLPAVLLAPFPGQRSFEATLEPAREAALVAPENLRLSRADFFAGQTVASGDLLAVLDADAVARDADEAGARAQMMNVASAAASLRGEALDAVTTRGRADQERRSSSLLRRRVARAELRAPFDGRVLTAGIPELVGREFEAGDTVCLVGDVHAVRARIVLDDLDLEDVQIGASARLRLRSVPWRALEGRVSAIEVPGTAGPAGAGTPAGAGRPVAWIALESVPPAPRPGLTGRLSVITPRRTAASQVYRWLARFVRMDLWI